MKWMLFFHTTWMSPMAKMRQPKDATWDNLRHAIYVRQAIEAGLWDSQAGRTLDVKEVRAKFGQEI